MKKPITKVSCIGNLAPQQKNNLAVWLFDICHAYCVENNALPTTPEQHKTIITQFANRLKQENIIIPYKPVKVYYNSKLEGITKRLRKEFPEI